MSLTYTNSYSNNKNNNMKQNKCNKKAKRNAEKIKKLKKEQNKLKKYHSDEEKEIKKAEEEAKMIEKRNKKIISLLPKLEEKNSFPSNNNSNNLQAKIISELGNGRALAFNRFGDVLTVNNTDIVIVRTGDYKHPHFTKLGEIQKRSLISPKDILSWPPLESQIGVPKGGGNNHPSNSVALRHYKQGEIDNNSPAVTKIFMTTGFALYCWDYDDSTEWNAYYKPLTNGQMLVNRITCGIDSHVDYGAKGHYYHDILFNKEGNLYISSGSFSNIDIDSNKNLTDERSTVKFVFDSQLKQLYKNRESNPTPLRYDDKYDSNTHLGLTLQARGIRNASGLALDKDNKVWCVNHGWDSMEVKGVKNPNDPNLPLWETNPAETVYCLKDEDRDKHYGFPYAFISATELSVQGNLVQENSLIHVPSTEKESFDAFGGPLGPFNNPKKPDEIADPSKFVQHATQILPKSCAALSLVINQKDISNSSLVTYDGRSDDRLERKLNNQLPENQAFITLKGSWNKLSGSGGAGFKVIKMNMNTYTYTDFYYNPTFSDGWDEFAGLKEDGQFKNGLMSSTVYRPTGIAIDKEGSLIISSNYNWMNPPFLGGNLVAIY